MVIFLGTAGIPNAVKGGSTVEALGFLKRIGLNAMEVEFVRGVRMPPSQAEEVGMEARRLGLRLSVHAPYFINLCSTEADKLEASKQRIIDSAHRAHLLGADAIAIHLGYYGGLDAKEAYARVRDALLDVRDRLRGMGVKGVALGGETMAKKTQFGTLNELLQLSRDVDVVKPYIDWAHLFARGGGQIDYHSVLGTLKKAGITHVNSHFEGLKKRGGLYVDVHDTVDVEAPPFRPLAQAILERGVDITLICESPYLEDDALKMKAVLEQLGYKFNQ
ncbi:MAG: TIM barrel protein [Thermoprotei archaeon]